MLPFKRKLLDLLKDIQKETKMGIIFITHDLSVVAEIADRVIVMYAGQIVEMGTVDTVFQRPLHPYTRSLLHSIPSAIQKKERLHVIQGIVPSLSKIDRNECRFKERIPWIPEQAHELILVFMKLVKIILFVVLAISIFISLVKEVKRMTLLAVDNLKVHFPIRNGLFRSVVDHVRAVDGVSFELQQGETYGLVGESGSGKSTIGKSIVHLHKVTSGSILFQGKNITHLTNAEMKPLRKEIGMIFQDPYSSLNPKKRVLDIIAEPLRNFHHLSPTQEKDLVQAYLEKVGLTSRFYL